MVELRNITSKEMKHYFWILLTALFFSACSQQKPSLQQNLEDLVNGFPGMVGVAVISGEDTICINGDERFPMFSVVKFHQALAVCEKLRNGQMYLSSETNPNEIKVTLEDLKPDTWSPMREQYPEGGCFSVFQLMEYALVESDNNACDILFNHIANPKEVNDYIRNLGIADCNIEWTEDEQHADANRSYDNWTTPFAAVELLGKFYEERDRDECAQFLWETMANCQTGLNRIPKYIADSTACIVHKTGTGGPLPDGGVMGINDIACIVLPDGSHFELAVFIKDALCEPAACEELIAKIAKMCFLKKRFHHEIYLGDPRKTAPEKLKTVIRYPIRKSS